MTKENTNNKLLLDSSLSSNLPWYYVPIGIYETEDEDSIVNICFSNLSPKDRCEDFDINEIFSEYGYGYEILGSSSPFVIAGKNDTRRIIFDNIKKYLINHNIDRQQIITLDVRNVYLSPIKDDNIIKDYGSAFSFLKSLERTAQRRWNLFENSGRLNDILEGEIQIEKDNLYTFVNDRGESVNILGKNIGDYIKEGNWSLKLDNRYLNNVRYLNKETEAYDKPIFVFINNAEFIFDEATQDKQEKKFSRSIVDSIHKLIRIGRAINIYFIIETNPAVELPVVIKANTTNSLVCGKVTEDESRNIINSDEAKFINEDSKLSTLASRGDITAINCFV